MTPRQAITEAKSIYVELVGIPAYITEIPTQVEKAKAIIEIARCLMGKQGKK